MAQRLIGLLVALLSPLALSACLVGEEPVIGEAEAVQPIAAGVYRSYAVEADGARTPDGRYTVDLRGADYGAIKQGEFEGTVARLKPLADDLFAVQFEIDGAFAYGALQLNGNEIEIWLSDCETLTTEERVSLGLTPVNMGECEIGDWDALATATALVVERQLPDAVWIQE